MTITQLSFHSIKSPQLQVILCSQYGERLLITNADFKQNISQNLFKGSFDTPTYTMSVCLWFDLLVGNIKLMSSYTIQTKHWRYNLRFPSDGVL